MSTFRRHWLHRRTQPARETGYLLTDRLHERTTWVAPDEIAATVSRWLAEIGVESPMVAEFARAVLVGDWAAVHAFGEVLAIDVALAA
jgi:hypothetical protein